ncbi:hypothetical protein PENANT_c001G01295 [Penicillium antarcticum]|uniref:Ribonuclease P/MRP protein subunit POP5 n=1 Tax=Penicillium antarcticum TaxID=416450 RepID=A0A1V6QNU3_9EURO|nr:uncharacterized protein N7508_010613 [Penicillium antarcticum]KAJ5295792.1 hypothetical protein N7508_010613 [Penicillium antarcticum]OQD90606.1 hypothetical protein PENANT_c001G01295 [Penicillium antarcticum]
MVRLKSRYLLIDILYPDPKTWPTTNPSESPNPTLSIHAPTSDTLTPGFLAKMVRETVSDLYGDWGVGKLGGASAGGLNIKYLSPATSTAIIRCPRPSYRLVWSALTYMSGVPETNSGNNGQTRAGTGRERGCVFRVIRVSGTMRKAEEEAIRRARREIVRVKDAEERGVLGGLVGGVGDALGSVDMHMDVGGGIGVGELSGSEDGMDYGDSD